LPSTRGREGNVSFSQLPPCCCTKRRIICCGFDLAHGEKEKKERGKKRSPFLSRLRIPRGKEKKGEEMKSPRGSEGKRGEEGGFLPAAVRPGPIGREREEEVRGRI